MKIDKATLTWMKESNPWTRYGVLREFENSPAELAECKESLLQSQEILSLCEELKEWYPKAYTRHNDPDISHYKLMMLAELGVGATDPGMNELLEEVKSHRDGDSYAMKQSLPQRKGDTPPGWYALPCDSPVILYSLLLMGDRSETTMKAVEALARKWEAPEGWFCDFFFVQSQYKKLKAPCPMAGLMALQVFSLLDEYRTSAAADNAFNALVYHKEYGSTLYYFGRSKKFYTFKYPFVWYNAFYMADVVSRFQQFRDTELAKELFDWVFASLNEEGRVKPTSMFRMYKGWSFADKKQPCPWMTFLALRILRRAGYLESLY